MLAFAPVLVAAGRGEECIRIATDRERLACFDAAFRAAAPAPAVAPAAVASAAPTVATERPEEFGLNEAQRREKDPAKEPQPIDHITARVVSAEKVPSGAWKVTLDNGQTWLQSDNIGKSVTVRPDDEVKIDRGVMGSFFLETPSGRGMRVKRVN